MSETVTTAGGGSPTLNSFSLEINAVPEPVNLALGIFAGVMAGLGVWRVAARKTKPAEAKL